MTIAPLFLPTYASWLNPIEKLWRWLRADVLYNHDLAHDLDTRPDESGHIWGVRLRQLKPEKQ
ncbi:MAG: transposase, partial [Anaerolinea sp.]|nr:transposase [Anaerolinea sp.]